MAFEQKPNAGTLWHQTEKKFDKAPDFSGSVFFDYTYLSDLITSSEGGLIEIKFGGWRSKVETRNGERHVLNLLVDNYKPAAKPASSAKDPWDD